MKKDKLVALDTITQAGFTINGTRAGRGSHTMVYATNRHGKKAVFTLQNNHSEKADWRAIKNFVALVRRKSNEK